MRPAALHPGGDDDDDDDAMGGGGDEDAADDGYGGAEEDGDDVMREEKQAAAFTVAPSQDEDSYDTVMEACESMEACDGGFAGVIAAGRYKFANAVDP
jgi:hypothetical protein